MMRSGDDWVKHPKVAQEPRELRISSRKNINFILFCCNSPYRSVITSSVCCSPSRTFGFLALNAQQISQAVSRKVLEKLQQTEWHFVVLLLTNRHPREHGLTKLASR